MKKATIFALARLLKKPCQAAAGGDSRREGANSIASSTARRRVAFSRDRAPRYIRYAAPANLTAVNSGADAISTTARPALVAMVQVAWPTDTPAAVATPARRPPSSVFRIVSAVSCPGVQITSSDTPKKATYSSRLIGREAPILDCQ